MATFAKERTHEAAENKIEMQIAHHAMVPTPLPKLQNKGRDPTKVTKKEIMSILYSVFCTLEEEKKKKKNGILVDILLKIQVKEP
jgi:hypothetical protein